MTGMATVFLLLLCAVLAVLGFEEAQAFPLEVNGMKASTNDTSLDLGAMFGKKKGGFFGGGRKKKKKGTADGTAFFSIPLVQSKLAMWHGSPSLVGPINVGGGHPFYVNFDTSSSNTWVYGEVNSEEKFFDRSHCHGDKKMIKRSPEDVKKNLFSPTHRCTHHRNYDPQLGGSTYTPVSMDPRYTYGIQYYDRSTFDGKMAKDTIEFKFGENGKRTLPEVEFLVVNRQNSYALALRTSTGFDGVVGLNTDRHTLFPSTALFPRMAQENGGRGLQVASFSYYMSGTGNTGQVTFGGHDPNLLKEKMTYFKQVTGKNGGYIDWTLQFSSMSLAGHSKKPILKKFKAQFVTNTPYAFLARSKDQFLALANVVHAQHNEATIENVDNHHVLVILCESRDNFPILEVKIKNKSFFFTGKEMFPFKFYSDGQEKEETGAEDEQCSSFFGYEGGGDVKKEELVEHNTVEDEKPTLQGFFSPTKSKGGASKKKKVVSKKKVEDLEWAIGMGFLRKYYVEFMLWKKKGGTPYVGIAEHHGKDFENDMTLPMDECRLPPRQQKKTSDKKADKKEEPVHHCEIKEKDCKLMMDTRDARVRVICQLKERFCQKNAGDEACIDPATIAGVPEEVDFDTQEEEEPDIVVDPVDEDLPIMTEEQAQAKYDDWALAQKARTSVRRSATI